MILSIASAVAKEEETATTFISSNWAKLSGLFTLAKTDSTSNVVFACWEISRFVPSSPVAAIIILDVSAPAFSNVCLTVPSP